MYRLLESVKQNKTNIVSGSSVIITIIFGIFYTLYPSNCTLNTELITLINNTFTNPNNAAKIASTSLYYTGSVMSLFVSFLIFLKDKEQKREKKEKELTKEKVNDLEKQRDEIVNTLSRAVTLQGGTSIAPYIPELIIDHEPSYEAINSTRTNYPTPINIS